MRPHWPRSPRRHANIATEPAYEIIMSINGRSKTASIPAAAGRFLRFATSFTSEPDSLDDLRFEHEVEGLDGRAELLRDQP